jgi:hypothetical protein
VACYPSGASEVVNVNKHKTRVAILFTTINFLYNLQTGPISLSVCSFQAPLAYFNVFNTLSYLIKCCEYSPSLIYKIVNYAAKSFISFGLDNPFQCNGLH